MHERVEVTIDGKPCESHEINRRRFFVRVSIACAAAIAALAGVPVIGFLVAPLVRPAPAEWRGVGRVDSFRIGQTVQVAFTDPSPLPWSGITAQTAAWLRRVSENEFIAFSINCRHLGCPVRWVEGLDCSCAHATAGHITTMDRSQPAHRRNRSRAMSCA